jgi:hypothetical protein
MYGMVHKGLAAMVVEQHGVTTWAQVLDRVGHTEPFLSNRSYPDELTYALVGATAEVLQRDASELLAEFGRYWAATFAAEHYRTLMDASGATIPEFLSNLNSLHMRVGLLFPGYRPPRFELADASGNRLTIRYYSERTGLAPFVSGLLAGIGDRFGAEVQVEHTSARDADHDHDTFVLAW